MSGELGTTNLLLGIMAAVSVLEALLLVGIGVAGVIVYRRVMDLINGLETRQIAPAPIQSVLKHFRAEVDAHVLQGQCPSGICFTPAVRAGEAQRVGIRP